MGWVKQRLSVVESRWENEASKCEMPPGCLAQSRHTVSGSFRLLPTQNNIGDFFFSLNLLPTPGGGKGRERSRQQHLVLQKGKGRVERRGKQLSGMVCSVGFGKLCI